MPLPVVNSEIRLCNVYPDRVDIMFTIDVYNHDARRILIDDIKSITTSGARRGFINCNTNTIAASISLINKNPAGNKIFVYVNINILQTFANINSPILACEISTDGKQNLLNSDIIINDMRLILYEADQYIEEVRLMLSDRIEVVSREIGDGQYAILSDAAVTSVEVAVDCHTPNPSAFVESLRPVFCRYFNSVKITDYERSGSGYLGFEGPSLFVQGFIRKGERAKAYEKTNRRVRLEVTLDKNSLNRLNLPEGRSVRNTDFSQVFQAAAEYALPYLNLMKQQVRASNILDRSPWDVLEILAKATNDRAMASEVLRRLCEDGRIASNFSSDLIGRLNKVYHLLQPVRVGRRGDYEVAPLYQGAINFLTDLGDGWRNTLINGSQRQKSLRLRPQYRNMKRVRMRS